MAEWKKVIVSGSSAELNQVTASGGFLGTLDGTASTASYVAGANVDGTVASATNATNATAKSATSATIATAKSGKGERVVTTTFLRSCRVIKVPGTW